MSKEIDQQKSDEDLLARIAEAKKRHSIMTPAEQEKSEERAKGFTAIAKGMRIGLEFVGGIVVGIGAGILLDKWLDTSPFMLIIFLFLGFGAGMMNIYRLINNMDATIGLNRDEFSVDSKGEKQEAVKKPDHKQ